MLFQREQYNCLRVDFTQVINLCSTNVCQPSDALLNCHFILDINLFNDVGEVEIRDPLENITFRAMIVAGMLVKISGQIYHFEICLI